jgi:hypothetical protein
LCRTAYCFPSSAITERVRLNTALRSEKLRLCVSVELSVAVLFYMLWVSGGEAGGIEYNPAPLPVPVRAKMSTQPGAVAHAAVYGSTWESVRVCSQN